MVCPIASADALARAWPSARYIVVPDAGHSVWEPPVRATVVREVELFKTRLALRYGSWLAP
jgi:proline iminopeptidase